MKQNLRWPGAAVALLGLMSTGGTTFAQKQGGVLKLPHFDSPASMSILEEATRARAADDGRF
jgi:hypothetical protein